MAEGNTVHQMAEKHNYKVIKDNALLLVLFLKLATFPLFFNPTLVTALSPLLPATSSTSLSAEKEHHDTTLQRRGACSRRATL